MNNNNKRFLPRRQGLRVKLEVFTERVGVEFLNRPRIPDSHYPYPAARSGNAKAIKQF